MYARLHKHAKRDKYPVVLKSLYSILYQSCSEPLLYHMYYQCINNKTVCKYGVYVFVFRRWEGYITVIRRSYECFVIFSLVLQDHKNSNFGFGKNIKDLLYCLITITTLLIPNRRNSVSDNHFFVNSFIISLLCR